MKANIHPNWYQEVKVVCACGNSFTTGSTMPEIRVQICSNCHPFFTGQQKYVDTLGQVERFQQKEQKAQQKAKVRKQILERRSHKVREQKSDKPTLRDLLTQARKNLHT